MAVTSPYDDLTPESIKMKILEDLRTKGVEVETREGSYTNTLVSEAAYQIYKLYQQFPSLLSMVFPDENAGEYLDKNAAQVGMARSAGTKAQAEVVFTGADGTVIPEGTALYAPESGLKFVTRREAVLSEGSVSAPVEADGTGSAYNLPAGSITSLYVTLPGILSVSNPLPASDGTDPESDAAFFSRYHARRTLPITSGNKNHYITWATETTGVAYASCIPLWDGNGTVKVVAAGADRGPVTEEVLAACAAHIEENRPIGAAVTVVSVTRRTLPLTAQVALMSGYTAQDVAEQLEEAVDALLMEQPFGIEASIPYSRFLAKLLQCPGVADYSSFTVDGGTSAVVLAPEDAAVAGDVTVTIR